MSRLQRMLSDLRTRGEKALGLFLTNGFPEPERTLSLLRAIDEGGADFVELGMPFSDPLAEGLPIQRSSERALRQGVTLADALRTAAAFRETSDTPLILMGYINPIFHYGPEQFCRDAARSGVDGLILPDLPPEERAIIEAPACNAGLDLIFLIAPNTPDARMAEIDRLATGFVYAVSITGLTGSGLGKAEAVETYLAHARQIVTRNPLLVGFGIRTHDDAVRLSAHTDGVIVGSALIQYIEGLWDQSALSLDERFEQIRLFASELKHGSACATTSTNAP